MRLIYFLYRVALTAAFPFIKLYALVRGLRDRRYLASLPERCGLLPPHFEQTTPGAIWLHAVSVGEVLSAVTLVGKLRAAFPSARLFVSSGTLAGRALAAERLKDLADGVFYAPFDYCFAVRAVLRKLRPLLVIVLETEIWPNLWRETRRSGAAFLAVNARISDRAMPRYRAWRWFFSAVLRQPDAILAQSRVALERFRELGAPADRLALAGNLKYDFTPGEPPQPVADLLSRVQPGTVWIAASTMPPARPGDVDEDDAVLDAFHELAASFPRLLLMLVPRKPERFDEAAGNLARRDLRFLRRSRLEAGSTLDLPGVLLVDTIGELGGLFALGDVVFMGGSLADRGGHNLLEPAFFGKPIICGPHLENFPEIAEDFRAQRALVEIAAPGELGPAVARLLTTPGLCDHLGELARRLAVSRTGAADTVLDYARRLYSSAVPRRLLTPLETALLLPLAELWRWGAARKRRRQLALPRRLSTPVISVGSIAIGGAGKTPLVLFLAEQLRGAGLEPGFLTRGYRRRTPSRYTILPPGSQAPADVTGDEAQILLRSGLGPLGIGADRHLTGLRLTEQCHTDVLILDDGFQHWRLARDIDLVVIDALDPFAGGALFPAGRLREPPEALSRADAFVLTRTEAGRGYEGIERLLRQYNATAPLFRACLQPRGWVDACTQERLALNSLAGSRCAAFCGLGNPASFWKSLEQLGCDVVHCWTFPDHHHYRPQEITRLARHARNLQATVLLTTQKDALNLPHAAPSLAEPLKIHWLDVALDVEPRQEFLDWLRSRLPVAARRA